MDCNQSGSHLWDFPGSSAGVGWHFLLHHMTLIECGGAGGSILSQGGKGLLFSKSHSPGLEEDIIPRGL